MSILIYQNYIIVYLFPMKISTTNPSFIILLSLMIVSIYSMDKCSQANQILIDNNQCACQQGYTYNEDSECIQKQVKNCLLQQNQIYDELRDICICFNSFIRDSQNNCVEGINSQQMIEGKIKMKRKQTQTNNITQQINSEDNQTIGSIQINDAQLGKEIQNNSKQGDVNIKKNVNVEGNIFIEENVTVQGNFTIEGNVNVEEEINRQNNANDEKVINTTIFNNNTNIQVMNGTGNQSNSTIQEDNRYIINTTNSNDSKEVNSTAQEQVNTTNQNVDQNICQSYNYYSEVTYRCQLCGDNCKVCTNNDLCQQCQQGYSQNILTIFGLTTIKCEIKCGDGFKHISEQCDDNNTEDGDGCANCCEIQNDWFCYQQIQQRLSKCSRYINQRSHIIVSHRPLLQETQAVQPVKLSLMPSVLLRNGCIDCSKALKITILKSTYPVQITVDYFDDRDTFAIYFRYEQIQQIIYQISLNEELLITYDNIWKEEDLKNKIIKVLSKQAVDNFDLC